MGFELHVRRLADDLSLTTRSCKFLCRQSRMIDKTYGDNNTAGEVILCTKSSDIVSVTQQVARVEGNLAAPVH